MTNISTFDGLSNELIISIFDYLEPAHTFQAFFDYNNRLRKLVKCYVDYDRYGLDKDIERFSTLHSWYKHLGFEDDGVTFYMVPLKGQQERYNFSSWIDDYSGIHWHFWREKNMPLVDKRIEQISQKYPIKLNPLFHPQGSWHALCLPAGRDFVRQYYPTQYEGLQATLYRGSGTSIFNYRDLYTEDAKVLIQFIHENEPKRLRKIIHKAAQHIWKEIQALEDVNILEIEYKQKSAGFVMCVTFNELLQSYLN